MPISGKTGNIIWGQFAGRCSICKKKVVLQNDSNESYLIGEVAHIVGEKETAARGISSLTEEERNSPDNLILLCRNHHKKIDDNEKEFTVGKLHEIKDQYLKWVNENLCRGEPWNSNISQFTYINVPRLSELALMNGHRVNLQNYKEGVPLYNLGFELNYLMLSFKKTMANLSITAIPFSKLFLSDNFIGSIISFDRINFRTKNIKKNEDIYKFVFKNNTKVDPYIYFNTREYKIILYIDPTWITTSTAFVLFRPSSGQSNFSGLARITNIDHDSNIIYGTPLAIGVPKSFMDECL